MSKVLLSQSEIKALLRARAVLMAIEDRARKPEYQGGKADATNIGIVVGTASCAEWAVFSVMNAAASYCKVPVDEFRPTVDSSKRQ